MLPLNIDFKERANFGKGGAKKLRKEGEVPCVVSSTKLGPISLSIPKSLVDKMVQSSKFLAHVFEANFTFEGKKKSIKVLPIKVDFHPVNSSVLHIDFQHVTGKTAVVQVPVKILGADKSVGLKKGGKLNLVRYHLPLNCNIDKIPDYIPVDISKFGVGRSFFASNLKFEKGIEIDYDCLILSIIGRGKKDKAEGEEQVIEAQNK